MVDEDEHLGRIKRLRELAAGRPRPLAVLADLPGPKLRALLPGPVPLTVGQEVVMAATTSITADIHVTEPQPIQELRAGQRVLRRVRISDRFRGPLRRGQRVLRGRL